MNLLRKDHLVSMVAAPIIWSVHFLICYLAVSFACLIGGPDAPVATLAARVVVGVSTVAALVAFAWTARENLAKYREMRARDEHAALGFFMARSALGLTALSAVAATWVAAPMLVLPVCAV